MSIRRMSVDEISARVSHDVLYKFIPEEAARIADRLHKIPVVWNGKDTYPFFTVAKTGRIFMSKPSLQNRPEVERVQHLTRYLRQGEKLRHFDFAQAEPTILLWELRQHGYLTQWSHQQADVYNDLASIRAVPRNTAKADLLALFYSPGTHIAAPREWLLPPDHYIHTLIGAVDSYRNDLFRNTQPIGKAERIIHTARGRPIRKVSLERGHRGKYLAWRIQGTLADIFNGALAQILDGHDKEQWRLLLQVHDSVYIADREDHTTDIVAIMEGQAKQARMPMTARTK